MPKLGKASIERLSTCHSELRLLVCEVAKHYDLTVICGRRGKEEQDEAFRTGKSQLEYPNSKHNSEPSTAIDMVPYPIDWNDKVRFYHFIGFVRGVAAQMGIKIRCGADWDGDFDFKDQNFHDLPHFELILEDENKQGGSNG